MVDFADLDTIEEIKNNIAAVKKDISWNKVLDLFDLNDAMIGGSRMEALLEAIHPLPEGDSLGKIDIDVLVDYVVKCRRICFAVFAALLGMFKIDEKQTAALETIEKVKNLIRKSGVFPILPIEVTPVL